MKGIKKIMSIVLTVIAVLVVLAGGSIYLQNQKAKIDLGLDNGKLKEIPQKPNCVSTQTQQEDKKIKPMAFKASLEETKAALKKAFEAYGNIDIKKEESTYLYAVATTGTMKFHDDIEVYFDESNKVIQYRSASRAGYSDMGLNKERYQAIVDLYNEY